MRCTLPPTASRRAIPCLLALGLGTAWGAAPSEAGLHSFHEANVLGTSLDLAVCASAGDAEAARAAVMEELARLDGILSTHREGTDLARVNGTTEPVKVAREVLEVLGQYDCWAARSNGAFSGRIGAIAALWKDAEKTGAVPTPEQVAAVAGSLKSPLWKLDAPAGTVQRLGAGKINIDSLGKGFVVSQAAAVARQKVPGVRGLMLDIGGDVVALGTSSLTTVQPWAVGVADPAHPADNAPPLTKLQLQDRAVATSGSYERGYVLNGKKYSHLLDPRSGYPVDFAEQVGTRVASATVVAKDAATANALAASLNVLRAGEGFELVASVPGAEALIVLRDGTQMRTPGFKRFENGTATADGKGWADGFELSMALQFADPGGRRAERPYVAVWVEDSKGEHVATLAEWGNNGRWMNGLSTWWRSARGNNDLIRAVSRATRPAGKYTLTWNGTNSRGEPVVAGTYKIFVEFAYEHNGHSVNSATIACEGTATTATIAHSQHFADVALGYAAKQATP